MKTKLSFLFLILAFSVKSSIVYVDHNDALYQYTQTSMNFSFDIDGDGFNDIKLEFFSANNSQCSASSWTCPVLYTAQFKGLIGAYGQQMVNAQNTTAFEAIDCTNDTLGSFDSWVMYSKIFRGCNPSQQSTLCQFVGYGNKKQGFRLIRYNSQTGTTGYTYGYIDYTVASTGDIIIHGWYYEDILNVQIIANTLLDYPFDGNCIVYDTVQVYDTIPVYVSVTDTLIINTTLDIGSQMLQTIIKIFPNPTNDFIYVTSEDFVQLSGCKFRLENGLGQIVYQSFINQPQLQIDIMNLGQNGLYYAKIIDSNSQVIHITQILLQ